MSEGGAVESLDVRCFNITLVHSHLHHAEETTKPKVTEGAVPATESVQPTITKGVAPVAESV